MVATVGVLVGVLLLVLDAVQGSKPPVVLIPGTNLALCLEQVSIQTRVRPNVCPTCCSRSKDASKEEVPDLRVYTEWSRFFLSTLELFWRSRERSTML